MQGIVNDEDIEALCEEHRVFRMVREKYGSPPNWKREPGFVSLSRIILEQQVSLESANAHFNTLDAYLPKFSPEEVLKLSDLEMRQCQISRQKSGYLRGLSKAVLDGDLDFEDLGSLRDGEVREALTKIKGIGNWTADIYLMFCLQRKDIFPMGDIAVIHAARELLEAETKGEVLEESAKWKPRRSLAAYFLWHYYLKIRNR